MRITVRLDDDLHQMLKEHVRSEDTSMTELINRALRDWLAGRPSAIETTQQAYREKTFDMG
jgi:Arc/MetJ-type ribon-helix-helix transcriptional regulator